MELNEQLKQELNELKEKNPWKNFNHNNKDNSFLIDELETLEKTLLTKKDFIDTPEDVIERIKNIRDKLIWEKIYVDVKHKKEYRFEHQFPLPINGNFEKADYILLYSNPATEEELIEGEIKKKIIKSFILDKEANLVIANENWKKWYKKQIGTFYVFPLWEEEYEDFYNKFCFINFVAYQTKKSEFCFTNKEIEYLKQLESTKFIMNLVKFALDSGKKIFIIRKAKNVWIGNLFHELKLPITSI